MGKTTRVSVRSQMKGDIDEYFSESSSESEEEEESQDRRQVSLDILEEGFTVIKIPEIFSGGYVVHNMRFLKPFP